MVHIYRCSLGINNSKLLSKFPLEMLSVYHLYGKTGCSGRKTNGTVCNTFRGIIFFSLLPKRPEFSVPFVHITRPWILSQREQRDSWQDGGCKRNFTDMCKFMRAKIVTMRRR